MNLLVIDDCLDIRDLMVMLFEDDGHKVRTADCGEKALVLLDGVDLIFVDYEMGGMTGPEFIAKCPTHIPCVMLTGHDLVEPCGAREVILKSVGIDFLLSVVKRYDLGVH